ncbi:E3 ubiquitin-protein ligase march2 [Desmophyllum pertusum]|uniref:E3 ubiquitin-protein ligase march2 n=1 Tax=Desmophyllum pertusum TaxID=174260 RepID=A0A9W9ZWH6_9CNID|nr:E3 ubiquitin-protein ligase march2 [Desmophyllum pertusum]
MDKQQIIPTVDQRTSPVDTDQSTNFQLELSSCSSDDLLNTCRICRDETVRDSLISPCHCSGTLGKCHVQCLEEWLSKANKDSCEICGHVYHTVRLPRSFKEWLTNGQNRHERRYLVGDFACFLILSPFVIVSSYLCTQGAWHYMIVTDTWTGTGLITLSLFLWCIFGFWIIVTIRFHQKCWHEWRDRNHVVRLVKIERFDDVALDSQESDNRMETPV